MAIHTVFLITSAILITLLFRIILATLVTLVTLATLVTLDIFIAVVALYHLYTKKRALVLTKARSRKSGDDLLSHKHLQYHRRCWA